MDDTSSDGQVNGHKRRLFTAQELSDYHQRQADRPWVWDQLAGPDYLTLVSGRPKAGKSTLLFGLCSALRNGQEFLGQATRPVKVAYCCEERWSTFKKKAEVFGFPDVAHLYGQDPCDLATLCQDLLHEQEEHGFEVAIIDTWTKWANLGSGGINDNDAVRREMQHLEKLAESMAVILVGYQRKGEGEHGEAVMGATEITGRVDVILEIVRTGEDGRQINISGRTDAPEHLPFRMQDGRMDLFSFEDMVFEALLKVAGDSLKPPSGATLVEYLGARKERVLQALRVLESENRIRAVGSGPRSGWMPVVSIGSHP